MADSDPRNNLRFHRMIARIREQLNAAYINTRFRISNLFQADQSPAPFFPHAAFAFTILAILGLLQVKYQGKDKTPFDSHPKTISLAILSLLIYGFAYGIQLGLPSARYNRIVGDMVHFCMFLAGSLSIAATVSFLFPDSVRPLLFVVYFITSAVVLLDWVHKRYGNREQGESDNGWWGRSQQFFMTTWQRLAHRFTEHLQILPL